MERLAAAALEPARATRGTYRPYGTFRFLLSLMVVFQHSQYLLPTSDRAFFSTMGFGVIAVMLFFIISGFVIAEANATFYVGRPVAFMVNRTIRLVPPYIAALALAAIVQQAVYASGKLHLWDGDLIGSPLQIKVLLAGLFDIVPFFKPSLIGAQDVHFIPFAWSLRLEFTFYIYVFISFVLMGFLPQPQLRYAGYAAVGLAYAMFVLYVARGAHAPHQLDSIPFFLLGMAMFALWQKQSVLTIAHTVASLVGVTIAFPLWIQVDEPVVAYQMPVVAVLLAGLFWLTFRVNLGARMKAVDKRLGDLSYPLYINHFIVLLVMSNVIPPAYFGASTYLAGALGCIALSEVMLRAVDVPMKGLRDRVRGVKIVN